MRADEVLQVVLPNVSNTVLNVKMMLMLKIPAVIAVTAEMVTVMITKAY